MKTILALLICLYSTGLIGASSTTYSQIERYELGKRLRRFEEAWAKSTTERQLKATPLMQQAVGSFFGLQLKKAAARLDEAWTVVNQEEFKAWQKELVRFRIKIDNAVIDVSSKGLHESGDKQEASERLLTLEPFYGEEKTKTLIPPDAGVVIWLVTSTGKICRTVESNWKEACNGLKLSLRQVPPGDYLIRASIVNDNLEFTLPSVGITLIDDFDSRLEKLEQIQRNKESGLSNTLRATLGEYGELIRQGREGFMAESDYPYHQMLSLGEFIAEHPNEAAKRIAESAKSNDVWLVLTEDRKRVPVRIRAPQNQPEKMPVLFLFHGAGGSENMFFETYGAGATVQLGLERGWLVVAPRQGLMGLSLNCEQMMNALEPLFDIDRKQVYLLGHSMGAAQVIQQVSLNPGLPRAAAAIGGGRPTRDPKKIAAVPWFVSAGELDFGRGGAKSFHQSLINADATNAVYVEYPGIEHMVIVQAALPKAFEFFDQVNKE